MPTYKVGFKRLFEESGEAEIEAEDDDVAREIAMGMLVDDDNSIEWRQEGVDSQFVEDVTEIENG